MIRRNPLRRMKLLTLVGKVVIGCVVAVVVLTLVGKVRQQAAKSPAATTASAKSGDKLSAQGFFLLSAAEASNSRVVVMTPPNCPSADARRARALVEQLEQAGVPVETRDHISAEFTDPAEAERVNQHMSSAPMPLVIVRGWAKGAPTLDQVIAQYQ